MKKLILILMLCFAVGAAQLESTGNGTTDGTNWTGGVTPANGDTLTIRSADSIALPSGDSIYATVVVNGKFAIYGTLGIKDSLQLNDGMTLRMGPGAIINGNGAVIDCAHSTSIMAFYLNGEDGNRCKIINTGDFGIDSWRTNPIDISYCDFVDCERINFYPVLADYVSIKHSAFINAPLYLDCEAYNNTFDIVIDSCDFRGDGANLGSGETHNIIYIYADYFTESTGSRRLDHCTFSSDSGAHISVRQKGFTISNSVLHNIQCGMSINYRKNFCVYETVRDYTAITGLAGYVDSNIIYTNRGNPHLFYGGRGDTITNNLVYLTDEVTDGADIVLLVGITGNTYISGNLFWMQKDGSALNSLGYANSGTHTFTNNTIFTRFDGYGTVRNENGGTFTGTVNLFNNLLFNRSSNASSKFVYIETAGDNQIDYTDYNGFYDISDIYYQVTFDPSKEEGVDSGFGLSDLNINPQFYDTTRTIATFNSVVNGGDESYDSTTAYMLRLNGYDGTVSTKNIDTIYKWLSYGFRPTNDSIVNSGLDGGNIGAFDTIIAASEIDTVRKPNWPLEVITWDMAKAHPGVLYDFRLGVIGGEYPYKFELIEAPEGMIIDTVTGAILWNAPSSPSTTNAVDVKITDKKNDTLRHAWNIEVTATGFYFVDSLNGNDDNTGAIAAPFQTFDKAYKSLTKGDIVYLRDGTYHTDSGATFEGIHYPKMILLTNKTPQAWLGFPGETVRLNGQFTDTVPSGIANFNLVIDDKAEPAGMILQNIKFVNSGYHTIAIWSANRAIVRKCSFSPMSTSGAENPSYIYSSATGGDIQSMPRKRVIIQENEMAGLKTNNAGAASVFYDIERLLYEDNYIHNIEGNGINIKQKGYYCTVRNNIIDSMVAPIVLMAQNGSEAIDVGYNLLTRASERALFVGYQMGFMKDIFIHHNTFTDAVMFRHNLQTSPESKNYNFYNNIVKTENDAGILMEDTATLESAKIKLKCDSNLYNCYFNSKQAVMMVSGLAPRYTLADWQAMGFDSNSQFKDPGLVNYEVPQDSSYFGLIGRDFYPESGWSGELPRLSGAKRVWTSTGSSNMNLATNYSGSGDLLTTDTLLFDGTSDIRAVLSGDLTVRALQVTADYNGAMVFGNHVFACSTSINIAGADTLDIGSCDIRLLGDGKFTVASTAGIYRQTTLNPVFRFYGKDTIVANKAAAFGGSLYIYDTTTTEGTGLITISTVGQNSIVLVGNACISGNRSIIFYVSESHDSIVRGNINGYQITSTTTIQTTNTTGTITVAIPTFTNGGAFVFNHGRFNTENAHAVYNLQHNLVCLSTQIKNTSAGTFTFNTNGYNIYAYYMRAGSTAAGRYVTVNANNSVVQIRSSLSDSTMNTDSAFFVCNNAKLRVGSYVHSKLRISGTFDTTVICRDLFVGNLMIAEQPAADAVSWYEGMYGSSTFANKGESGTGMVLIADSVTTWIQRHQPNRVFMWAAYNDLWGDSANAYSLVPSYWTRWRLAINKIKAEGVDSIYVADLAPAGTVESPLPDWKKTFYRNFNSALKDSAAANHLYLIETYDSLLLPGTDNVMNPAYSVDGIYPNGTVAGRKRIADILNTAYIPTGAISVTSQPENDTVLSGQKGVFTVGYTGDSVQIAWYKNNVFTGVYGDTLRITGSNGDSVQAVLWNAEDTVSSSVAYLTVVGVPVDTIKISSFDWVNSSGNMFPASGWSIRIVRAVGDTLSTTIARQDEYGFGGIVPSEPLAVPGAYPVLFTNGVYTIVKSLRLRGTSAANGRNSLNLRIDLRP